ncbi:hypothetical protein IMG5_076350 [Ichthyophthirius multifiliis]|uniref:Uncharacterized protein n=1 Tax=Ichthyophthirius multifiliis TaxID=5932 RepID=G0QQA4_ICHMU|nr:hypothetical protein IMG5_076350 [Ichthyophthirius multifiliis]EGR32605.1 hypothetical protein IMG5_076350 [Ichthyophthirius multifiliis]|eukprot:XP_004036591.1 hypothetical protein IMG5_076350 [Ichthyophthirius multifiliis]
MYVYQKIALSYSRTFIIKHLKTIETVAFLCFFQDDMNIFEKSCDLIHTVILTLCYVYPIDISYLNKSEVLEGNQKFQYLSLLKKTNLKKLQLEWYEPGDIEKKVILEWIQKTLCVVLQYFEENYFSKPEKFKLYNYEKDYREIIDQMLFDNSTQENIIQTSKLQKDFYKLLYVALASFSGSNVRIPFILDTPLKMDSERQQKYIEIYKDFQEKFMFKELLNTRNDLMNFCLKLPSLFHSTKTIQDVQLIEMYQYLTRECFGESYLIEEIKRSNEMLDGLLSLNDYHKTNIYSNRYYINQLQFIFVNYLLDLHFQQKELHIQVKGLICIFSLILFQDNKKCNFLTAFLFFLFILYFCSKCRQDSIMILILKILNKIYTNKFIRKLSKFKIIIFLKKIFQNNLLLLLLKEFKNCQFVIQEQNNYKDFHVVLVILKHIPIYLIHYKYMKKSTKKLGKQKSLNKQ